MNYEDVAPTGRSAEERDRSSCSRCIWVIPTYLVVVNAMTPVHSYTGSPVWWPAGFAFFDNVVQGWVAGQFGWPFLNSLLYALVGAGVAVLLASMAAFGLVIMPVRRTTLWFWLIYAGTLLPLQVFALPLYQASVRSDSTTRGRS